MEQEKDEELVYNRRGSARDRALAGIFLIIAGSLLFAYKMGAPLPAWLFTFPTVLIAIGLIAGLKHRFRHPAWIIPFGIGVFLSVDQWYPGVHMREYTAPVIIIMLGLFFLLRPKHYHRHNKFRQFHQRRQEWKQQMHKDFMEAHGAATTAGDSIDSVSVFGSVKKKVVSKNFTGGEITCFMGGAELDLSQADIQGRVVLDITQLFGGTKLIIPPHWDLKSDMAAIFGGIEDKRPLQGTVADMNKVLVLRGTSIFGGIDIKSY
jgi:predicted membrane protein